jgi:hypothetical protein
VAKLRVRVWGDYENHDGERVELEGSHAVPVNFDHICGDE